MKKLIFILLFTGSICQGQDDMVEPEKQDTFKFELDTLNAIPISDITFDTLTPYYPVQIKDTYEVFISLGLLMEYKINHRKATFDDFIDWLTKSYYDEKKRIKELNK